MPEPVPLPQIPRDARAAAVAESLARHALTALVAPAGYGKTTLLSLGAARLDWPAVRYSAELWHAGDFVEPLVEVIRAERPGFGRSTLALARRRPRAKEAHAAWARQLGATFARELDHVPDPIVVTLDDAQVLANDPHFAEFVAGAVRALPAHAHLGIAGRALPDLPLAEWIAAAHAQLFSIDDVRFDRNDVRALAREMRRPESEADLDAIVARYEGWTAGIALAFAVGDTALPAAGGSLPAHSAYLIDANLRALDDRLEAFLQDTAVFETLDANVLEREPDFAEARVHLGRLERQGIMLDVVRAGETYRVHPMLRDALMTRVRQRGPQAAQTAHRRAAVALERAGRVREALFHYEHAGDDAGLARFVGLHAYDSFVAGQGERIARIAKRLQREGIDAPAAFAVVEGMIARQRGEPGAEDAFARGIAAAAPDDPIGLACRMLLVEDRLARRTAVEDERFAELFAAAPAGGPLVELNAHVFAGWAAAIRADFDAARTHARRALAIAGDEPVARTRPISLLAYAALGLGDFATADATMSSALRSLEASDHAVLFANSLVWYARFALLWNDVAAARDYAERGRALARELDLGAELAGVELALAEVYARVGDRARCDDAARNAVRESAAAWYASDRERTPALAALWSARAAAAAGDAAAARDKAAAALAKMPPPSERAALAADLAAYARLLRDPAAPELATNARELLDAATANDALDAALLADAAALLAASGASGSPQSSVRDAFGAFLSARTTTGVRALEPLLQALGPSPSATRTANGEPRNSKLTARENEILQLIAQGLSNREIAQRFTLSPRTVDTHVERVLSKLGANSRTRAVATALRLGMLVAE